MGDKRTACSMCQGTDTQRECEQGQCYVEQYRENEWHRQREIEAEEDWRRRCEEERNQ